MDLSHDPRREARAQGLALFTDLRALARGLLSGRTPAAACRAAQYVVVDHQPRPLEGPAEIPRLERVAGGIGTTARPPVRATVDLPSLREAPPPRPPSVRVEVRQARQRVVP